VRPKNGVTVSTKDRHREHHAVTASTNPAVHILIHSDVYILKFSDGEQAVPPAAGWRDTTLPPTLTAARVTALLDSCDRTSLTGLRDFAVLTVLARLGLRAAEVAGLELGDVDWRTGEIVVRGKGRRDERLPLSADGLCDDDGTHIGRPRVPRDCSERPLAGRRRGVCSCRGQRGRTVEWVRGGSGDSVLLGRFPRTGSRVHGVLLRPRR